MILLVLAVLILLVGVVVSVVGTHKGTTSEKNEETPVWENSDWTQIPPAPPPVNMNNNHNRYEP